VGASSPCAGGRAIAQLTDDGLAKGVYNSLQTDGPRIYFNEGRWGASPDHKSLYYTDRRSEPRARAIRSRWSQIVKPVSLKDFRFGGFTHVETQVGFTPDALPVFTRDIGTQEIYALSVKWP